MPSFFYSLVLSSLIALPLFSMTLIDLVQKKGHSGDCVIVQHTTFVYAFKLQKDPHAKDPSFFVTKASKQILDRSSYASPIDWFEKGSPNTIETGSYTLQEAQKQYPELFTFLSLDWKEQPEEARKKRGAPPMGSEPDFRPLWEPKIIINGTIVKEIKCRAYESQWPDDGSGLAKKQLIAYFPVGDESVAWFPYWVEVPGVKAAFFVIDSKKGS